MKGILDRKDFASTKTALSASSMDASIQERAATKSVPGVTALWHAVDGLTLSSDNSVLFSFARVEFIFMIDHGYFIQTLLRWFMYKDSALELAPTENTF